MKSTIISWLVLCALILGCVVLGYQNGNYRNEIRTLQTKIKKQETLAPTKEKKDTKKKEQETLNETTIISSFFKSQFNYDNASYVKRIEESKKFLTQATFDKYKESQPLENPNAEIKSSILTLKVGTVSETEYLVYIKTNYEIAKVPGSPVNQLYQVKYNQEEKKIESFQVIGSFSSTNAGGY